MDSPPFQAEAAIIGPTSDLIRRIEIYESNGTTHWEDGNNDDRLIGGSVNVDYSRDERRSFELELDNTDHGLEHTPENFWYDKIIKVFCGVRYVDTTPIISTTQRINLCTNPSFETNVNNWSNSSAFLPACTLTRDTGTFYSGSASMKVTWPATSGGGNLGPNPRTNLFTNPSFETNLNEITVNSLNTARDNAWAASGTYALSLITNNTGAGSDTYASLSGDVGAMRLGMAAGGTYTVGATFRMVGTGVGPADARARRIVVFHRIGAGTYNTFESAQAPTNAATRVSVTFTLPAGTTEAFVRIYSGYNHAYGTTQVWWDAITFEQGTTDGSYFDGSSANCAWSGTAHASTSIYTPGASSDGSANHFAITATVGRPYTATARIFVPSGQPNVEWGDIWSERTSITAKDEWIQASVTVTAYQTNMFFGLVVDSGTTATDHCYIDSVLIEETDQIKQYFDGSSTDFANYAYSWEGTAHASRSIANITYESPSAVDSIWEVQVGEFMIDQISEDHFPFVIKVSGRDYTKKCLLSKFTTATTFTSGTAIETVIRGIAQNAGITKFLMPPTGHSLGKDYAYERGVARWEAMKEIASAFGYELFFDAQGYLVMREFHDPVLSPTVYTLATGPLSGNLVSYNKTVNDNRIYNKIVVTGESTDSEVIPVAAIATNTSPTSPTRIEKLGERVYQYTSAFITTTQQAQDVADKFLSIHALEEFDLNFSSIALPWLEVGEIIEFDDPRPSDGQPTRFLLSSLNLPLSLEAMSGNAKRVSVVG